MFRILSALVLSCTQFIFTGYSNAFSPRENLYRLHVAIWATKLIVYAKMGNMIIVHNTTTPRYCGGAFWSFNFSPLPR